MENLNKALLIRNGNVIGTMGDKYFSTAPLGTVLAYAGQTAPRGYLLADGASYPTAEYPDLYAVIGNTYGGDDANFNVPDYRETVLVGVGENTTDTIASHDVYELGEFKDDQSQDHTHTINTGVNTNGSYIRQAGTYAGAEYATSSSTIRNGRKGTTTHGKQKGVTYIIKAFHTNEGTDSGVSDDVIEYVEGELDKKAAIDDTQTSTDTVWSSKKTSDELATKQENMSVRKIYARRNSNANKYILLSTIDMSKITYIGQPLRIKGVIGNMASDITNIDLVINARNGFVKKILSGTVTHKNFLTNDANIIITKSDDEKTAYVYLYCISTYGYIDAEIYLGSVHYSVPSTFDLVETMQGTEYTNLLDTNYVVIENVINDTASSITSTYSSAKIDEKIAKHSLPIAFDSGIINNSTVQVYKLANVGYTVSGGTDAYNLNLLLSSRGAEEIELVGGKNDGGWIIEAIRNNKSFNKITNIYQDGLDIYVRLDLRCNYFRVYHKSGVLSGDFAVSLVDTIPETATELTVTEYATKADLGSNVPMTEIAFTNSTNWSNSSGNLKTFYMVRNGWCFLHVVAHCNKVANDNNSVVYGGLPIPPFQVYGKFVGEDNTYEPCNLTVATNGQMLLRGGTAGKDYSFTYTYPVV